MANSLLWIGLMSGTSLDGVDGVLVGWNEADKRLSVLAHSHRPFDDTLRTRLLALNTPEGMNELHTSHTAAHALAHSYASVVADVLTSAGLSPADIRAIGSHGQTIRHCPSGSAPYTVQLQNAALLAELTGIDVIADFRSRDVAAGGQGAPLVPAFHQALFGRAGHACAILNLGGISNLTWLGPQGEVRGFDCGPANMLMDLWCQRHTSQAFDQHGQWAASGQVQPELLRTLLAEPYFVLPPPKSTGRDLFNSRWLDAKLPSQASSTSPQNIQATLCELTALSCANDIHRYAPHTHNVLVCGGGALNTHLMQRLAHHLPQCQVQPTDTCGLPAMQVEACAFAWLAQAHIARRPGNLAAVTGARGPRILGALYPA
jgi:anhydro-N-acetylmuramic acid kinase